MSSLWIQLIDQQVGASTAEQNLIAIYSSAVQGFKSDVSSPSALDDLKLSLTEVLYTISVHSLSHRRHPFWPLRSNGHCAKLKIISSYDMSLI